MIDCGYTPIEKIVVLSLLNVIIARMTSNLSLLFKKYTVPTVFTLLGITMVVMGIQSSQNSIYMIATLMMLIAGGLSFAYSTGKIGAQLLSILGIVALVGALAAMYLSYDSVRDTQIHNENYKKCVAVSKLNLEDIRTAQKAHAEKFGKYAPTWEALIEFIENGEVPVVKEKGTVPNRALTVEEIAYLYGDNRAADDNMTEMEAWRLSKWEMCPAELSDFRRDTVPAKLKALKFESRNYVESREKAGAGPFVADSLPYIPMANGEKWTLQVKDSIPFEDGFMPAIRVGGTLPFAKVQGTKAEEMYFGSENTTTTEGSWEK